MSKNNIAEADVHTATPSLGNAAATWAGWAVTAVAAKFYRSQSDTGRPQRPQLTGKAKPASLGMLEHPFNEHTKTNRVTHTNRYIVPTFKYHINLMKISMFIKFFIAHTHTVIIKY